jgi:hypothetical protein
MNTEQLIAAFNAFNQAMVHLGNAIGLTDENKQRSEKNEQNIQLIAEWIQEQPEGERFSLEQED